MKIFAYGSPDKPQLLLLPGLCSNGSVYFKEVIPLLMEQFQVVLVCFNGFDGNEHTCFVSLEEETKVIEGYIEENYGGRLFAAFGSSLGGSVLTLLLQRRRVSFKHVIISGTDFDHLSKLNAFFLSRMFGPMYYKMAHDGVVPNKIRSQMKMSHRNDSFTKQLCIMGVNQGGYTYVKKSSVLNQFYSEWTPKLQKNINVPGTMDHCIHAKKTGDEYLKRYKKHFSNPNICVYNMRHEELLFSFPREWTKEIEKICGLSVGDADLES